MSQSILCLGVRDVLRTGLSLGNDPLKCDLALGGKPHPMAGQVFYAVHPYGWDLANQDYDLDEIMGVKVTISKKLGTTPLDRTLTAAWSAPTTGLDALCRAAMRLIHRQQSVRAAANSHLGASDQNFATELWFVRADPEPAERNADWFSAASPDGHVAIMGLSITMTFGRAERIQTLTGMT